MHIFLSILSLLLFVASPVDSSSGPCSVLDLMYGLQCADGLEINGTCITAEQEVFGWSTNCTECLVNANISAFSEAFLEPNRSPEDVFTVTYPCVGDIVQESCTAVELLAFNLEVFECVGNATNANSTDDFFDEVILKCSRDATAASTDCRDCSTVALFYQLTEDGDNVVYDDLDPLVRFCISSTLPTTGCEAVSLEDAIVVLDGCGYGDGIDEGNDKSMDCVTQGCIGVGGSECGECFYSQWLNQQYLDFLNVTYPFDEIPDDDGFGWPLDVWNALANCGAGSAPTPTAPTPTAPTAALTGGAAFFSVSVINVATTIAAVIVVGY